MNLAAQRTPLIAALEQLGPHDHFCSIYENREEHYGVAIAFMQIGLDRGEKCIYIADDGMVGDVRQAMQSEGIDVERATASKALVLATKEQAYLRHGSFNPDWMFTFWEEATQSAMSEGFYALRDQLSERKRAEEALRRSRDELDMKVKDRTAELRKINDDLQSVNKELEAFAYSVSHDLRAPLRHIAGFTELLLKDAEPVLDDKSRRHITKILQSANRMDSLVDDLLAFSRIGRVETQKTTVNLEQLVRSVVAEIAPDTQGRRIVWRIGALPICYGDPSLLQVVFSNLVSNAVKFTRTREQANIEIDSLNHGPNEVVVFVREDRKSTRLNSSHSQISYAVFCLKKK